MNFDSPMYVAAAFADDIVVVAAAAESEVGAVEVGVVS